MSTAAVARRPVARELTLEQWADLDEDEPGELVDGVLEEEEMPTFLHEAIAGWIYAMLLGWVAPRGGKALTCEAKFFVGKKRGRKPDVSVYLPGRPLPRALDGGTAKPPSIMVEVLSPRPRDVQRDRIDKLADYARFGVAYYWIVDPQVRSLEIVQLGPEGQRALVLSVSEGKHPVPGCEGLVLDLDAVWAAGEGFASDEGEPKAPRRGRAGTKANRRR